MNILPWQKFKYTYYDVAIQYIGRYAIENLYLFLIEVLFHIDIFGTYLYVMKCFILNFKSKTIKISYTHSLYYKMCWEAANNSLIWKRIFLQIQNILNLFSLWKKVHSEQVLKPEEMKPLFKKAILFNSLFQRTRT